MTTTLTNGRQRKSLADQIERLDSILDGLADGLNEAVATAVKEAVRAVLTKVLTNPELLARLHPVQPIAVPEPPRPSRWLARAWDGVRSAIRWTAEKGRAGWLWLGQACGSVRDQVAETTRRCRDNSIRLLAAGGCHCSAPAGYWHQSWLRRPWPALPESRPITSGRGWRQASAGLGVWGQHWRHPLPEAGSAGSGRCGHRWSKHPPGQSEPRCRDMGCRQRGCFFASSISRAAGRRHRHSHQNSQTTNARQRSFPQMFDQFDSTQGPGFNPKGPAPFREPAPKSFSR